MKEQEMVVLIKEREAESEGGIVLVILNISQSNKGLN